MADKCGQCGEQVECLLVCQACEDDHDAALTRLHDRVAELDGKYAAAMERARRASQEHGLALRKVAELEALTDWLRLHEPDAFYRARRAALHGDGDGGRDE